MQQPANISGTPVIVSVQTAPIQTRRRYIPVTSEPARQFKRLGVAHIVIGALCITFQIISLGCVGYLSALNGHAIWIASQFLLTGVFGIFAERTGRKCQVITFHVLSTVSAVFALTLLCLATVCAAFAVPDPYDHTITNQTLQRDVPEIRDLRKNVIESYVAVAMEALLAILAIAEGIVSIRSSVIGCMIGACCCKCRGLCCCPTDSHYQQLHNLDQPDVTQQQSCASSQQEPTFSTNQQQSVLNQHQPQLMFNPSQKQLPVVLNPNPQPPLFNPSQQQIILLSTQPNVGFYPQQAVQYYALQPITVLGSHQIDVSTVLSGATGQVEYAGPLRSTELTDTPRPDENTGTSGSNGSDKGPISSDDVEMLTP